MEHNFSPVTCRLHAVNSLQEYSMEKPEKHYVSLVIKVNLILMSYSSRIHDTKVPSQNGPLPLGTPSQTLTTLV